MPHAKHIAILSGCLLIATLSPSYGRLMRNWSTSELTKAADIIVVATIRSTKDQKSLDLANTTWVPVYSTFDIKAVLKGDVSGDTITVQHYRYSDNFANATVVDGPEFVAFDPKKKNEYIIYLKKGTNSQFEPLTGQIDPWISFYQIQPYHQPFQVKQEDHSRS